ncbi:MAG TPA: DNA repair protein RecN [Saprospiraceae bacterium]|nr:DNA repair protein RecN [Saprospiraceae bacterium]
MLKSLLIRNYAIIDHLDIRLQNDLTVLTGETGAGKSIIIGALQLLMGGRADAKVLRQPDEKCVVEASFSYPSHPPADILEKFDVDPDGDVIIRREILPNGKSRSFINDTPALISDLQEWRPQLLSIHQQFDHLDFFDKSYQLSVLDTFAGLRETVGRYQEEFKQYQSCIAEKAQLENELKNTLHEKEFMQFQWNELDAANVRAGEIEQLEADLKIASKAEEIKTNTMQSAELLQGERGIIDQVQESLSLLKAIRVNEALGSAYDRMEQIKTELKDLARELESLSEQSDFSAEQIRNAQQRLDQLNRLLIKHRVGSDQELLDLKLELESKLDALQTSDARLDELQKKIDAHFKSLSKQAELISKERKSKCGELVKNAIQLLHQLGMEFARFEIQLKPAEGLRETGSDAIDFLFSANKGSILRPIKDQVSGGELARFNLAVKSLMAQKRETGCLVFDEIDTGVSGQVALQMGKILKDMAAYQQVICITHSPQVASRAQHHFHVYKEHEEDQSVSRIKAMNKPERMHELAKMLSGDPPTQAALKNAAELMAR